MRQMTMEELALPIKGAMRDGPFGSNLKSSHFVDEGIKVIRTQNIKKTGYVDQNVAYITPEKAKELERYEFKPGDLVIAKLGSDPGVAAVIPESCGTGIIPADVVRFRGDPRIIDHYYLARFLNSPKAKQQIEKRSRGSTRTRVNLTALREIVIDVPTLKEQERIASILDKADEIKNESDKAQILREDLVQSLFYDMFGDPVANPMDWQIQVLGDICGVGSSKRVFKSELVEEGIPFYRGTEIGKLGNGETITPSLFITKQHYETLKEHSGVPRIGDLLMPSICPDGRIFTVISDSAFYFKDGRVLWIKVDQSIINSTFLRYLLKAIFYSNYENIASGTTFAELKIFALKKMMLPLPPIELQDKFARTLKLIKKIPTTEVLVETNSNSLIQEMLT